MICAFPGNETFGERLRAELGAGAVGLEWRRFPDGESYVRFTPAAACSAPHVVMRKTRFGDRRVEIQAPPLSQWKDRRPVLLDDIIASASTMALAAKKIQEAGLDAPVCVGVHGVFSPDALGVLRDAGAARIVTTNTIAHETNAIDVSSLVARGIESVQKEIRNAIHIR